MGHLNLDPIPFPQPETMDDSDNRSVGARAPTLTIVGAHSLPRQTDRHNNPTKARISLWPDSELLAQVKQYCYVHEISYTSFFELAAETYMTNRQETNETVGARPHVLLDIDDFKPRTDEYIINLYRSWTAKWNAREAKKRSVTKPRWNKNDDTAATDFNSTDPRILEIALMYTLANKAPGSGPIRSFKYYTPELRIQLPKIVELAPGTINAALATNRRRLNKYLASPLTLGRDLFGNTHTEAA